MVTHGLIRDGDAEQWGKYREEEGQKYIDGGIKKTGMEAEEVKASQQPLEDQQRQNCT